MKLPRVTRVQLLLAGLWAMSAFAPAAAWALDEAAALRTQREALQRDFERRERACSERFAVNACVDAVRRQRREALAPLRERELQLDAQLRAQRADERRASIAAKQAERADRADRTEQAAPPGPAGARAAAPAEPAVAAPAAPAVTSPRRPLDTETRAAQAAERVRAAQQRQRAAQATQQRVVERQRERERSGRRADPLPLPASAAAAR